VSEKFDAIVVGAGPAGCACGYSLAKAGINTLMVERGKFPGAKNMWGGAFYGPVLHRLFPHFWEEAPVERFVFRRKFSLMTGESSLTTEFSSKKFAQVPYDGFTVLRSGFDRWFALKAEQAGAIVAAGLQADDLLRDGGRICGIKAGGDELPADAVIACDGVNSLLAEKAGLREKISPKDVKQGIKEVIELPGEVLEQRFNLKGDEGLAWEFIGTFSKGIPGGAFLYTNKESLSVGVVLQVNSLAEKHTRANDILDEFKRHPVVVPFLDGGNTVEYSAHLIPVSGKSMMPSLFTDGFLVAGDAAAFVLTTGLALEGANFSIASGIAAAETVIEAKRKKDFSAASLSRYKELLKRSFVLKDLETYSKAPHFLENPRIYSLYPELACEFAEKIFTHDGLPKEKIWKILKNSVKGKTSFLQILRDLKNGKRSL
jgi:electron transfer flavoprotein-quinone oxidoreductase